MLNPSSTNPADRINAVRVSVEDLLRAAAAIHRLAVDERDWRARAMCAAKLFKDDASDKAYAVTARLEAMSQLVEAEKLPEAFAPRAANGARVLAESVFKAAAIEPLLGTGPACYFDPDAFLACVFRHAQLDVEDRA